MLELIIPRQQYLLFDGTNIQEIVDTINTTLSLEQQWHVVEGTTDTLEEPSTSQQFQLSVNTYVLFMNGGSIWGGFYTQEYIEANYLTIPQLKAAIEAAPTV